MAILLPRPKEDAIDKLVKALSLANSVVGLKANIGALKSQRLAQEQLEKAIEGAGIISPIDFAKAGDNLTIVEENSPGALKIRVGNSQSDAKDIFVKPVGSTKKALEELNLKKLKREEKEAGLPPEESREFQIFQAKQKDVSSRKLAAQVAKDMEAEKASGELLAWLDKSRSLAEDAKSPFLGPVRGRAGELLVNMGFDIGEAGTVKQARELVIAGVVKAFTGAQASDKERAWFRRMVPGITETKGAFDIKIQGLKDYHATKQKIISERGLTAKEISAMSSKQKDALFDEVLDRMTRDNKPKNGEVTQEQIDAAWKALRL